MKSGLAFGLNKGFIT
jgi:large subunit ribosomal protein L36e